MSLRSCGLRSSIGALPVSAPARPIATMYAAKTEFVRHPQRNGHLLRSIAYHRHYGSAAWIDPVVLGAITISRNNIVVPIGSWPYDGHPDEGPFGRLRLRCGTQRVQVAQRQGRSQSYNRYPHASTSLPHSMDATRISCDVRVRRCGVYIGHQRRRNRNVSFYGDWRRALQRRSPDKRSDIRERGHQAASLTRTAQPTFHFNNLASRAIIAMAGWRHEFRTVRVRGPR